MRYVALFLVACGSQPHDASPVDATDPDASDQPGVRAVYYRDAIDQVVDEVEPAIDFTTPPDGVGADNFAVRWTGTVDATGDYAFAIDSDSGVRLWIDNTKLIDAWSDGAHEIDFTAATLHGPTTIKLTYYHRTGDAHVRLRWRRPDGTEELVPLHPAAPQTLASPPPPYTNSVDLSGCADPGALAVDGTYYLACTGGRFRIHTSRDLVTWKLTDSYILPAGGPTWSSTTDYRWAPEIHPVGNHYVAYFTSADDTGQRAIGLATADSPLGPYTLQAAPLVTNPIGVIDPTFFADDDGKQYLIWKVAGNSSGKPTPIMMRELNAAGTAFTAGSTAIELIRNDPSTFEGPVTEAPWMLKRNGTYYLFYSGNTIDENYRVGVARAAVVTGPYTKHSGPILGNTTEWLGPGHNSSVQIDGIDYLVYHAWRATPAGALDTDLGRVLMIDRIDWVDGWPQIDGNGKPSMTPRPRPGLDPDE
ncbi:MAG: family 43 glycosylhydrolase [Kofleriaceae bacterium]